MAEREISKCNGALGGNGPNRTAWIWKRGSSSSAVSVLHVGSARDRMWRRRGGFVVR